MLAGLHTSGEMLQQRQFLVEGSPSRPKYRRLFSSAWAERSATLLRVGNEIHDMRDLIFLTLPTISQ